jgi:hypothetical protein
VVWSALATVALGFDDKTSDLLWRCAATSGNPALKALCMNFELFERQLGYLSHEAMVRFLRRNVSPRSILAFIEEAVQQRCLRRKKASSLEERLLASVSATGDWL